MLFIYFRWRSHTMPLTRVQKDDSKFSRYTSGSESESAMDGQTYSNVGRRVVDQRTVGALHQHLGNGTPQAEKETSAVDAMLRLSCTSPKNPFHASNLGVKQKPESLSVTSPTSVPLIAASVQSPPTHQMPTPEFPYSDSGLQKNNAGFTTRKHREFIPEFRKDDQYWSKRRKNNDAAKRSREKRRLNDIAMGATIHELTEHNTFLWKEIDSIKKHFGLQQDKSFLTGDVMPPTPIPKNYDIGVSPQSCPLSSNETPVEVRSSQVAPQSVSTGMPSSTEITSHGTMRKQPMSHAAVPMLVPVSSSHSACVSPRANDELYANPPPHYAYNQSPSQVNTVEAAKIVTEKESQGNPMSDINLPQHNHYYNAQELQQPQVNVTKTTSISSSNYNVPQSQSVLSTQAQPVPITPHYPNLSSTPSTPYEQQVYNSAAVFHSNLKAPDISPLSPDSSCSDSPRSLTISFTNSDSSDTDMVDKSPEKHYNQSPDGVVDVNSPYSQYDYNLSRSRERKGIPHKLRHKMKGAMDSYFPNYTDSVPGASKPKDILQSITKYAGHKVLDSADIKSEMSKESPSDPHHNTKYFVRRHRNNLAAQKCRENRKQLTNMRMAKATVLETENMRLKQELGSLTTEVNNLKGLIVKKKEAQAKGERFNPVNMETEDARSPVVQVSFSSSSVDASSSDAS